MWCVAICHEVKHGAHARSELFQAHVAHNVANIGAFLFVAPLASEDGVSGVGDDPRLRGSIYCLDVESYEAARRMMETDPFMHAVWHRIDYYRWKAPQGQWLDVKTRPRGLSSDYRCYVAASAAQLMVENALICGAVEQLGSTGNLTEDLTVVSLLRAACINEARNRAAHAAWIAAAPVAIGYWVGISSAADLQVATVPAQAGMPK